MSEAMKAIVLGRPEGVGALCRPAAAGYAADDILYLPFLSDGSVDNRRPHTPQAFFRCSVAGEKNSPGQSRAGYLTHIDMSAAYS